MNSRSLIWLFAALLPATAFAQAGTVAPAGDGLQPVTVGVFGQPVELSGSWEYTQERRRNFDLNLAAARDRRVGEHEVKLNARTRPSQRTEVYVQVVGLRETRRTQRTAQTDRRKSIERGETWVRVDRVAGTGFSVQAGRVPLAERRAWWWDDELDAVRLLGGRAVPGSTAVWRLDTGVGRELLRVSSLDRGVVSTQRGVLRWFGQVGVQVAERHALDAFWLVARDRSARPAAGTSVATEDDTDPSDLKARWIGVRASGEWRGADGSRLAYWADAALLRGREALTAYTEGNDGRFTAGSTATRRVRGHATDIGATLSVDLPLRPAFTVALARGSGGVRNGSLDANFRQTGLQENKVRFGGVKRVMRYGELLQPELSNLKVTSVGASLRLHGDTSLDLIRHRYRQLVASTTLAGSRLATDPLGTGGDIGSELDVVLAMREWRHLELTLRWSRFMPGSAFAPDRRDAAHAIEVGAALEF
jgi:alginate production protein